MPNIMFLVTITFEQTGVDKDEKEEEPMLMNCTKLLRQTRMQTFLIHQNYYYSQQGYCYDHFIDSKARIAYAVNRRSRPEGSTHNEAHVCG